MSALLESSSGSSFSLRASSLPCTQVSLTQLTRWLFPPPHYFTPWCLLFGWSGGGGGEKSTTRSILFSLRWSAVEPLRSKRGKDHVALLGLARPPAAGVRLLTALATGLSLAVLGFNFHFVLF